MAKSLKPRGSQAGFTLLEMLISVTIMTLIMAAIFGQIKEAQQVSAGEQTKVDMFQQAREFMDQLSRDLRAAGYPNSRNFSSRPSDTSPQLSWGLVSMTPDSLQFESSIDGSGTVWEIYYTLVTEGENCPCIVRSQAQKFADYPTNQGALEFNQTEVQGVLNAGTAEDPIFTAYDTRTGLPVTKVSINSPDGDTVPAGEYLANINTLAIVLKVRAPIPDPKTGVKPTMTLLSTVKLNNCSQTYPTTPDTVMGCGGT
jgi:prepilin-type N-terminal cleavage/methylation domain-containing protein